MFEILFHNLTYRLELTIFLFGWPIILSIGVSIWKRIKRERIYFGDMLYHFVSIYFGINIVEARTVKSDWLMLGHRFIGILAWAYITAIFIATITS